MGSLIMKYTIDTCAVNDKKNWELYIWEFYIVFETSYNLSLF